LENDSPNCSFGGSIEAIYKNTADSKLDELEEVEVSIVTRYQFMVDHMKVYLDGIFLVIV
jgi:hypothetical protein